MFKMKINRKLLPMKAHFFLYNAALAPLVPYLSTYARQLGFSAATVGLIYTVLPITGLIAKPLFGAIADRFKIQKFIFILFQILTGISFLCIYIFIPESRLEGSRLAALGCNGSSPIIETCYGTGKTLINPFNTETAKTSLCQISCDNESWSVLSFLCDKWNMPQFCNTTGSLSGSQGDVGDILSADNKDEKCIYESMNILTERLKILGLMTHSSLDQMTDPKCVTFHVEQLQLQDDSSHYPVCTVPEAGVHSNQAPLCYISCNNTQIQEAMMSSCEYENDQRSPMFWLFFSLMIINWVCQAVVVSLADSLCFGLLGKKPQHYGKQRLWGSLSWGTFSLIAGVLVDMFSEDEYKDYTVSFILMSVFIALDVFVSCFIQDAAAAESGESGESGEAGGAGGAALGAVARRGAWWLLLAAAVAAGAATALVWHFLPWLAEDVAAAARAKSTQGLVTAVQCFAGEMPFMLLSGRLLPALGYEGAMALALLALGARLLALGAARRSAELLAAELLHGPSLGLLLPTLFAHAAALAPPRARATVQGLVGGIFEGVGSSMGSLVAGRVFEAHGGHFTFRVFGVALVVASIVHFSIHRLFLREKPNKTIVSYF